MYKLDLVVGLCVTWSESSDRHFHYEHWQCVNNALCAQSFANSVQTNILHNICKVNNLSQDLLLGIWQSRTPVNAVDERRRKTVRNRMFDPKMSLLLDGLQSKTPSQTVPNALVDRKRAYPVATYHSVRFMLVRFDELELVRV